MFSNIYEVPRECSGGNVCQVGLFGWPMLGLSFVLASWAWSPYRNGRAKGKLFTSIPMVPSSSLFLPFRRQSIRGLLEDLESYSRKVGYHLTYVLFYSHNIF